MYDELKFPHCDYSQDPVTGCALEGAAQIIAGIRDVCLVIHSPQGCSATIAAAYDHHEINFTNRKVACTRLFESDIIMGAADKLRDMIRQADANFGAKVMFVIGTCAADIIGEDLEGICTSMQKEINARLIPLMAGGFRGNSYNGINHGLETLAGLIKPAANPTGLTSVNLVAPQASLNPTWWADLDWIKKILAAMDVRVQTVIAHDTDLSDLEKASSASANILLTNDAGYAFARQMQQKYNIPLILGDIPLPIGCTNTARWLRALGTYLGKADIAENLITAGENMVTDILRRRALMIIPRYRNCRIALAADATFGIGLLRMLFEELEMIPELVLFRSDNEQMRDLFAKEVCALGISPKVVFGADGYAIKQALDESSVDAVLGTAWERYLAQELGIRLSLDLLSPTNRDIYVDKAYFGYEGMLNMLEITGNDWETQFRSKEIRWEQYEDNLCSH